jgi:hypothetical protein
MMFLISQAWGKEVVMKAKVLGIGAKYPGRCAVCGRPTGDRPFELAETVLLRQADGKYRVAHARCTGGRVRHKVSGGSVLVGAPAEVEIQG